MIFFWCKKWCRLYYFENQEYKRTSLTASQGLLPNQVATPNQKRNAYQPIRVESIGCGQTAIAGVNNAIEGHVRQAGRKGPDGPYLGGTDTASSCLHRNLPGFGPTIP